MIDLFYLTVLASGVLGGIIAYHDYKVEKVSNRKPEAKE